MYGYTLSLHRDNEDPNYGFGYPPQEEEQVFERLARWNAHTCNTEKCGLCAHLASGGKYKVTLLGEGT